MRRCAGAAAHIAEITKKMAPETIIADVLPVGGKLSTDANSHVRTSFAGAVTQLAPQIGKTTSRKYLFDIVERCLKDPETEVQLKIITTLDSLKAVMVLSHFSQKVLETVLRLAHDRSWRCRLQTIELIPELITQLLDCQDELVKVSTSMLVDPVYAIRIKAIENIKKLIAVCGVDRVKQKILPHVLALAAAPLFLHCISQITPSFSAETITTAVLPTITKLLADPVPNVRFAAVKTFEVIFPLVSMNILQTRVKPALVAVENFHCLEIKHFNYVGTIASFPRTQHGWSLVQEGASAPHKWLFSFCPKEGKNSSKTLRI